MWFFQVNLAGDSQTTKPRVHWKKHRIFGPFFSKKHETIVYHHWIIMKSTLDPSTNHHETVQTIIFSAPCVTAMHQRRPAAGLPGVLRGRGVLWGGRRDLGAAAAAGNLRRLGTSGPSGSGCSGRQGGFLNAMVKEIDEVGVLISWSKFALTEVVVQALQGPWSWKVVASEGKAIAMAMQRMRMGIRGIDHRTVCTTIGGVLIVRCIVPTPKCRVGGAAMR